MSRFYGVRCDRCRETLVGASVSKLDETIDDQGWSVVKVGRSFVHFCEPCQEANEALRQAISAKLA